MIKLLVLSVYSVHTVYICFCGLHSNHEMYAQIVMTIAMHIHVPYSARRRLG